MVPEYREVVGEMEAGTNRGINDWIGKKQKMDHETPKGPFSKVALL